MLPNKDTGQHFVFKIVGFLVRLDGFDVVIIL